MSLSEFIIENEKVFEGAHSVKYLFMPAERPSKFLTVAFSGFNGEEANGKPPHYNYVKHLKNINCHRLFIIDECNGHPCYYLGNNKQLDYDVTVASLIFKIANQNNIPSKNIITCGSSKGGSAAVYFALKYNFGHLIAGGFQFKVGDYLYNINKYTRNVVLKSITGGNEINDKEYLNSIYHDLVLNGKYNTNINLHIGSGDAHYDSHMIPFTNVLKDRGTRYHLDVQDYNEHSKIGVYFSQYLIDKVAEITNEIVIKDVEIRREDDKTILTSCKVPNVFIKNKSALFAYYVYKEGENDPVLKTKYTRDANLSYKVVESGNYSVKVYVKKEDFRTSKRTSSIKV